MNFNVISPSTLAELLDAIKKNNNFLFGAGYTDLVPFLKNNKVSLIINLSQLKDKFFNSITPVKGFLRMGSLVTAAEIAVHTFTQKNFPVLHQAANALASQQIRNMATLGGNICTASPSGDLSCALVALKALGEVITQNKKIKIIPIKDFFTGPKKNILRNKEVLRSVIIPLNNKNIKLHSGFIKVGTRRSMECSVVSLAFHIQYNKKGIILKSGIAIGAVAPIIKNTPEAEQFLQDKNMYSISETEKEKFSDLILGYASPISDIRASAWYRKEVLRNISRGIFL